MSRRFDDLRLDDTPIVHEATPPAHEEPDARDTPWYRFVGEIDDLLEQDRFLWAEMTLTGIKETVERTRRVSDGQRRAVGNIQAAGEERGERRRYEGWDRRGR